MPATPTEKKPLSLNYVGFWEQFDIRDNIFQRMLSKHFNIEISQNPDFILTSLFPEPEYGYCAFEQPRIFFAGENFSPDFNLFDYCFGFDHLEYGDRYFRLPYWMLELDRLHFLETRHHTPLTLKNLESKPKFCNYIYGIETYEGYRERMLEVLTAHKRVDCAGRVFNNMPGGFVANGREGNFSPKVAVQEQYHFSFSMESTCVPGFCTEKIINAFEARSIPIYYGDETASKTFNPDAFIDLHAYPSFEDAAKDIIAIENDERRLLAMLNAPVFLEENYITNQCKRLEDHLVHIFSQTPQQAYRRSRYYAPVNFNNDLLYASKYLRRRNRPSLATRIGYMFKHTRAALKKGGVGLVLKRLWLKIKRPFQKQHFFDNEDM